MRISMRLPPHIPVIEAALEGLVRANMVLIEMGAQPLFPHDADIVYRLEPVDEEDWKLGIYGIRDGWQDCEDIAAYCVAGLRVSGEDPEARCAIIRTGPHNMHCVVQMSNGDVWDPSVDLGMMDNNGRRGVRKAD